MSQLQDQYEMSQKAVAEVMFLNEKTITVIEKRALEKMRLIFEERGISIHDLLED